MSSQFGAQPELEEEVVHGVAVGSGKAVIIEDEFKAPDPKDPFRKFRGRCA